MSIDQGAFRKLDLSLNLLKFSFALYFLSVGVDKFLFLLSDWGHFIASVITQFVPVNLMHLLYAIGSVEVIVGAYILFISACTGGIFASIFFVLLAVNMFLMKVYAGILIYMLLAVTAYVMSILDSIKKGSS